MTAARVYLDWNATAPLRPEARAAMLAALDETGNPSSIHAEGRRARAIVETAREQVAALVGAEPHNVIFTSGASEAAAYALTPDWSSGARMSRLYAAAIEHPCILSGGRFATGATVRVPTTRAGTIDIAQLKQQLDLHDGPSGRPLVAVMAANNETGIVQPVAEAAALAHAASGLMVCDAVQAAGRLRIDICELGADALLLSAHKLGGPKGVGALILADERVAPVPLLTGGGQERRQRAGTENVAGIAGFGAAAKAAGDGLAKAADMAALRDRLEAAVRQSIVDTGRPVVDSWSTVRDACGRSIVNARLPNTALLTLPGVSAQMLLMQLDLAGFSVSAGAACSSGKLARSLVLEAMGLPAEIAGGAIRVSIGYTTTADDIDDFVAAWKLLLAAGDTRSGSWPPVAAAHRGKSPSSARLDMPAPGGRLPERESPSANQDPGDTHACRS